MKAKINWKGKLAFDAVADSGHTIRMDAPEDSGGEDSGTRPKELLLKGLGGCTAMDVISILKKMKHEPESLEIELETELTEDHPKVFKKIHIRYIVKGDVPEDKLKRAIDLSQDMYCGVSAMLKKNSEITYDYRLNP